MAFGQELILRARLQPPRLRRWTLNRPRLSDRLEFALDYRLTLVVAPTGYGKSTALAGWLNKSSHPYAWYNLTHTDSDPFIFLLNLVYAFRERFNTMGERTLQLLEQEGGSENHPAERQSIAHQALPLLINEIFDNFEADVFLVLDDFHLLDSTSRTVNLVQELINIAPPFLHLVIASRHLPLFEALPRWLVRNELLVVDKEWLAFTPSETAELFTERYGCSVDEQQAHRLTGETEGWIIALQMVWQNLQAEKPLDQILSDLPRNLSTLFDYLAQEVLNRQEPPIQKFLLESAVLRRMSGEACDFVLVRQDSENTLRHLSEAGLFVLVQGDKSYRYHHLFGEFLYAKLHNDLTRVRELHQRAAEFYRLHRQPSEALHHCLVGQIWECATGILKEGLGQVWLDSGQIFRLENALQTIPAAMREHEPALLLLEGDCLRFTSRFNEALQIYVKAIAGYERQNDRTGLVRALRGGALVYLDTVQPALAAVWLERALVIADTTGDKPLKAQVLRDLAENKLNQGRPLEAEALSKQACALLGEEYDSNRANSRIYLRSGRLAEAVELLERTTDELNNHHVARPGRSHRERLLQLALIDAFVGNSALAIERAKQGIKLARELHAPFTEAVAWLRLGHGLMLAGEIDKALEAYREGQKLGDNLQVRRLRAESFMGLTLLHGRSPGGHLALAQEAADAGLQIARRAGDEWIEGCIQLSLAAGLTEHGEDAPAISAAQAALALMSNCGDRFGQTLAQLWLTLANHSANEAQAVKRACQNYGYEFLLERPTMFGLKNSTSFARLNALLAVNLAKTPSSVVTAEAGCRLQVTTLGSFEVRRADGSLVEPRDWQRDKARLLFQLFIARRYQPLNKEQILDYLWQDSDLNAAASGFKVALNALVKAIEPERNSRAQSGYVERNGAGAALTYSLKIEPESFWLDANEFEKLINQGIQQEINQHAPSAALALYNKALQLYKGDFLPGCLYEDWAMPERERLKDLFLTTAERVARLRVGQQEWEECLVACKLILSRDNCWEEAYRLMMLALWKQGNRTAALRTYGKCLSTLDQELGIAPMPSTVELYEEILNNPKS
jgi:ATP/maltotriose-dependent transcriptional regulator MalT/two-component SAPR family response regulator